MDVVAAWGVIEEWLAADAPSIRKSLRPPGDDARVEKLQKKLKLPLPPDFIASVRVHDGQKSDAEHGPFPAPPDELGSVPSYRLLPLTDSGREWAMMKKLRDQGEFDGRQAKPGRGVRRGWWDAGWVPIADDGGGDYFCLDLAPGKGGTAGQVIVFLHDMDERPLVAKSYAAWLGRLAKGLASGRYVLDEGEGVVER